MTKSIVRIASAFRTLGLSAATLVAVSSPALAHHPMGGAMPTSFGEGLLSGIGHPIIGLDHFAFILAVGLLSLACGRRFAMPLAFVLMTAVGTLVHLAAVSLPLAEIAIAASVLIGGAMLIVGRKPGWMEVAGLFAIAGLFHGFAYGEAIFGAETTPVVAYLAGFTLTQYGIAVGTMEAVRRLAKSGIADQLLATRIAGGVVAGMAVVMLSGHLMPI